MKAVRAVSIGLLLLAAAGKAQAQDSVPPAPAEEEERSTGLPGKVDWNFNFDAGLGSVRLLQFPLHQLRPDPSGDLSDNWVESYVKPALSGTYGLREERALRQGQRGRRADLRRPAAPGRRGGLVLPGGGPLPRLALGHRARHRRECPGLHGRPHPVQDRPRLPALGRRRRRRDAAAASGATRARPGSLPASPRSSRRTTPSRPSTSTGTRSRRARPAPELWGVNYELALGETNTLGATYLQLRGRFDLPSRDGMSVYNLRAYLAPFKRLPGLSFEREYAQEDNGDLLSSTAWNAQAALRAEQGGLEAPSSPTATPSSRATTRRPPTNEGFDSLIPGFYDWGTWWQGEIAGEYFLSNSNLDLAPGPAAPDAERVAGRRAHRLRVPADQPASFGPGVTSEEHRDRARRVRRLEAQQQLHRQLRRRLRRLRRRRWSRAIGRTDELHLRNDLRRLLLLTAAAGRSDRS